MQFRRVELECELLDDNVTSQERKQRQLVELGKKESDFLRLRRTNMGMHHFGIVKVIGKGAFGEVNIIFSAAFTGEPILNPNLGEARSEEGYGKDLRYESPEKG
jgi:hypothetical protein